MIRTVHELEPTLNQTDTVQKACREIGIEVIEQKQCNFFYRRALGLLKPRVPKAQRANVNGATADSLLSSDPFTAISRIKDTAKKALAQVDSERDELHRKLLDLDDKAAKLKKVLDL